MASRGVGSPAIALLVLAAFVCSGCLGGPSSEGADGPSDSTPDPNPAYVVVGVPDGGVNPYHEVFHRPGYTDPPCAYLDAFPCSIRALNLSIGLYDNYAEAVEADAAVWDSVIPGEWYWIPRTPFVAVRPLTGFGEDAVSLLAPSAHGTATTSLVLQENPDARLAFMQVNPQGYGLDSHDVFADAGITVDVLSVSLATNQVGAPLPSQQACNVAHSFFLADAPLYVKGAGNTGGSTLQDCWASDPSIIAVGGAYAHDRSSDALSFRETEVVSYFCPPVALAESISGYQEGETNCGTSYAAPMVAGALSRVVLSLRKASGYGGLSSGNVLDPILGVSGGAVRDAMNLTATYEPEARFNNGDFSGARVPLNDAAPWLQWGWGFYDSTRTNATLAHITGGDLAPDKPEAREHMERLHDARERLYGDR